MLIKSDVATIQFYKDTDMTAPQIPQQPGGDPGQGIYPEIEPGIPSIFSDFDLYLFGQGKHYHIYDKFGAHVPACWRCL